MTYNYNEFLFIAKAVLCSKILAFVSLLPSLFLAHRLHHLPFLPLSLLLLKYRLCSEFMLTDPFASEAGTGAILVCL